MWKKKSCIRYAKLTTYLQWWADVALTLPLFLSLKFLLVLFQFSALKHWKFEVSKSQPGVVLLGSIFLDVACVCVSARAKQRERAPCVSVNVCVCIRVKHACVHRHPYTHALWPQTLSCTSAFLYWYAYIYIYKDELYSINIYVQLYIVMCVPTRIHIYECLERRYAYNRHTQEHILEWNEEMRN